MRAAARSSLVPKLRFPEFVDDGPWDVELLDDLCDRRTETVGESQLTPVSISAGKGFVPQAEKFGRDISGSQYSKYIRLERGDFAFNRGNSKRFPQGCVYQLAEFDEAAASNAFHCFRLHGRIDPAFVLGFFENNGHGRQLIRHITSGARSNGLLNINADTFFGITIPMPRTVAEQHRIADCLRSLDDLIAAEGRKLAALRRHKRALMHQLFPEEGESLPRLRFPEFRDTSEWETTSLGRLADIQSGGTPSKANPAFWDGSMPWVSAKDMKRLFLEDTEDHISIAAVDDGARLVPAGTPLILTRGMTLLRDIPICVLRKEMSFNQDVKALRPKVHIDGLFLAFLLLGNKQRLLKMVDIAGHGTGKLDTDGLQALELAFPREPDEQERIVACLSSLEEVVAAQLRRLASLKAHKQGMLQQLYPSLEEESQ